MKEYIFASQEKESEYKRLCLIQDSFDDKSQKHLLQAGLCEGMDVLEIGVGAGSLANWIGETVGEKGSVLGIDLNTDYAVNQSNYELIEGDILDLEIQRSFDLIHLRYVLIHNLKAKDIIKKIFTLLKEGGKLVLEEPDFTLAKWIDAQDLDACKRVSSAVCKMFEKKGLKAHYGSTAYLSLEELGFEIEETKSYLHLCSGNEDVAKVMKLSADALSQEYLKTGVCSQEDIEAYISASQDSESLAVYYATIALLAVKRSKSKEELLPVLDIATKKTGRDGIYLAENKEEIMQCLSLMSTLRPHLIKENFVSDVQEQIKEGYKLFYLRKDSQILSLAGCKVSTNLAWGKHLYVSDLVSELSLRSKGYGKEILDYMKSFAKEEGCTQIHLDSGVQRFMAHKFYLREGFSIASHHFSYKIEM